jgi:hypothetical protein
MKSCWGITKRVEFCEKPTGGKIFCSHHRSQPIYFIIIAVTGILFSYVSGLIPKLPLSWEKAVYASPSSLSLHKGDWAAKTPISVWNKTSKPIHSVWVKFALIGEGITAESVIVSMPTKSTTLEGQIGDVFVSGDTYRINVIDSSGHEAVFVVLHTIPPATCRELLVSGSAKIQSHATVSVASFADVPTTMLESSGKVAFPFRPPENLKLKGISLLMHKEHR